MNYLICFIINLNDHAKILFDLKLQEFKKFVILHKLNINYLDEKKTLRSNINAILLKKKIRVLKLSLNLKTFLISRMLMEKTLLILQHSDLINIEEITSIIKIRTKKIENKTLIKHFCEIFNHCFKQLYTSKLKLKATNLLIRCYFFNERRKKNNDYKRFIKFFKNCLLKLKTNCSSKFSFIFSSKKRN